MEKWKKKSFQCEICDSHFKQKRSLKSHVSSVHEGKPPFKCEICDYRCSRKGNMKRHVESVHGGKNSLNATFVITSVHKRLT